MPNIWEEIKEAFKTKSQREEEKTKELADARRAEDGLSDKLEQLEKQYSDYLNSQDNSEELEKLFPSSLGLEKIVYSAETDEQIANRAKSENEYEKSKETGALSNKYKGAEDKLNEQAKQSEASHDSKLDELGALYLELKKKQVGDSVKKGVSRGSILSGLLGNLQKGEKADKSEVEKAYGDAISQINEELNDLNSKKEAALDELDLKYAAELDKDIASLKAERDKTVAGYEKYNNQVAQKETAYSAKREADVKDYLTKQAEEQKQKEAKEGYSGEKLQNYAKRYQLAYDFYMSLSEDIAAEALAASPNMRFYLGNYYDKLKKELENRNPDEGKKVYL